MTLGRPRAPSESSCFRRGAAVNLFINCERLIRAPPVQQVLLKNHERLAVLRDEERPWGALVHGTSWIPVWGFFVAVLMYLLFRNRSREMVFHVQQALQFQIYVLLPVVLWIIFSIFINIFRTLSRQAGTLMADINDWWLTVVIALAAVISLVGASTVYLGRPFFYPLFGRRVWEGSIRKISEV